MANKESVAPEQPAKPGPALSYRDTRYTSRVLVLPGGRLLSVAQGMVTATAGDTVALEYLSAHPDLMAKE